MSEIDMKNYAGEPSGSADVSQSEMNTYQEATQDYMNPMGSESQPEVEPTAQESLSNPQSEHFRALREEVDRLKAERESEKKEHLLQVEMFKANQLTNSRPQAQEETHQPFKGMSDSDLPSVGELRQEWSRLESDYKTRLDELQFAQTHPDYAEVLSKHLTPLIREKPILAEAIKSHSSPSAYAYELGKLAQKMNDMPSVSPPQINEAAQRIVENSRKPGTLSSAGGTSNLSKADYYASMSDQEFNKMAFQNLEGI